KGRSHELILKAEVPGVPQREQPWHKAHDAVADLPVHDETSQEIKSPHAAWRVRWKLNVSREKVANEVADGAGQKPDPRSVDESKKDRDRDAKSHVDVVGHRDRKNVRDPRRHSVPDRSGQ